MFQSSLNKIIGLSEGRGRWYTNKWWYALLLPLWVYVSFQGAQEIIRIVLTAAVSLGASFSSANITLLNTVVDAFVYAITLTLVIGLPRLAMHRKTSRDELGIGHTPNWFDFAMVPPAIVIYFLLSTLLLSIAPFVLPWFNANQVQNTGFSHLNHTYEYVLAFITLVVIAPFAEETLFRGYLLGKLRQSVPLWIAILITSGLFAFLHGAWNIGVDTFGLSIVLCLLRVYTKNIWASVMVHMAKNAIAYYLLFINPSLFSTL